MNDAAIMRILSAGLSIVPRPYRVLAKKLGVTEDEALALLTRLKEAGGIKRIGASFNHRALGAVENLMVIWDIDAAGLDAKLRILRRARRITHLYVRDRRRGIPGNVYAMLHGPDRHDCLAAARRISRRAGISPAALLFSTEELKKTPVTIT